MILIIRNLYPFLPLFIRKDTCRLCSLVKLITYLLAVHNLLIIQDLFLRFADALECVCCGQGCVASQTGSHSVKRVVCGGVMAVTTLLQVKSDFVTYIIYSARTCGNNLFVVYSSINAVALDTLNSSSPTLCS